MENNCATALKELLEKEANQGYSNQTANDEDSQSSEENLVRKNTRRKRKGAAARSIEDSDNQDSQDKENASTVNE